MGWATQSRHRPSRGLTACGLSSYILLAVFLTTFLFLGLLNAVSEHKLAHRQPRVRFPDFDKVKTYTRVLSESDVSLNNSGGRIMFVGDVHGMNESLHELLDKLSYDPSRDAIFFAGDLLAKSTHSSSLAVIDFLTKHHEENGKETIFPVRGNHDQMIIQWRSWRDWFETLQLSTLQEEDTVLPSSSSLFSEAYDISRHIIRIVMSTLTVSTTDDHETEDSVPPVHTGRAFLEILEHEWYSAQLSGEPVDAEEYVDVARKRARGTWREAWWTRIPPPGKGRAKQQWKLFGDHYWLAKDLSQRQRMFLENLPLVNHIPHLHLFVAHAGLLPADPTLHPTDRRQPLARIPTLSMTKEAVLDEPSEQQHAFFSRIRPIAPEGPFLAEPQTPLSQHPRAPVNATTIAALRRLQETAITADVAQNRDPWVVLNMRSVKKSGKVTRNGEKGTPWSDIWAEMMEKCDGFGLEGERARGLEAESTTANMEENETDLTKAKKGRKGKGKDYKLSCYPSTVIYGHAASRGLDIKRWSFGLDTGCLYGQKLTSLVLQRARDDDEDDEDDDNDIQKTSVIKKRRVRFGDKSAGIQASLISVACPTVDEDEDDDHDHDDDDHDKS